MFGIENLGLFITAGLLLNLTPGPDTLLILGRTLAQGRSAGMASVAGIGIGCLVHTAAAAFGLSAVLVESAFAFQCIKWMGAGYLVFLGVGMIRERGRKHEATPRAFPADRPWIIFRQAVLTNVLNPKVALFFLAFLPQFVPLGTSHRVGAFLFLGMVFVVNGTLYCLGLVIFASVLSERLRKNTSTGLFLRRATGLLFIGLGLKLALERRMSL